ncbi:MAG: Rpn family recombination-promoting nuclease/putative transposase [Treponema sp.]|jgi:predicted transposase/invertase (TIGR01784 family)|nr:Rpn family recombination-promoting nuclease/putative transposase [Treponema sp.]
MGKARLNPLNDYMFLKIMGEKGDEEQLCAFLNAVLGRHGEDALVSVEILENRRITAEVLGDKTSILDVRAITAGKERIDIEVQLQNLGNMDRRSLFYWSREFSMGMAAGQYYEDAPNVIAINIVNYEFMAEAPAFHLCFHIREDTYRDLVLTDALEIHFIDMVKFRRLERKEPVVPTEPLHRWLMWMDKDSSEGLVKEIIKMDSAIRKAEEKMVHVSMDKEALRAYHLREMALSDWASGLNHARQEGRKEGREEGMKEGIKEGRNKAKREVARNLKSNGIPVEQITLWTGLSLEEIGQL